MASTDDRRFWFTWRLYFTLGALGSGILAVVALSGIGESDRSAGLVVAAISAVIFFVMSVGALWRTFKVAGAIKREEAQADG